MASMTDYLNKLVSQKNTLVDNLVTKGVAATHDETLETLVPKVLDISSSTESKYAKGIVKEYNDFNNLKWVEIIQHNDNSFVITDENTIECCFNYSVVNSSSNQGRILETKDSSESLRYILNIYNGFLEFSFNVENWYSPTESGDYHIDTYEIIPNTLYNITAVFKNAGTDIYINGVLFVSIPETIAANTMIKNLCLKASFTVSNRDMEGRIFSLRMYNRALSKNEILQNYETDVERYGIGETKTYWYKNGIFNKSEFDIANSDNWIFVSNTNQSKSISINENNQIEIVMTQNEAASCSILINSIPIDVTDIKQVIFNIDFSMTPNSDSGSRGTTIAFAISDTNNIGIVSDEWSPESALANFEKSEYIQNPNNATEYTGSSHIILDVSDISGERYFYFTHIKPQPKVATNSDTIKINSIYVV